MLQIKDASKNEEVPFAQINTLLSDSLLISNVNGQMPMPYTDSVWIRHPLFQESHFYLKPGDSVYHLTLSRKDSLPYSQKMEALGTSIFENYQKNLPNSMTSNRFSFDYLTYTKIKVLEQTKNKTWEEINDMLTIEKNRFVLPDKRYSKIVSAQYSDGDTSRLGYIPANNYAISSQKEYFSSPNLKYYNPLYKEALKRYEFVVIDSLPFQNEKIYVLSFKPKKDRKFNALEGIVYISNGSYHLISGYYEPKKKTSVDFSLAYFNDLTTRGTRFLNRFRMNIRLTDIPNIRRNSIVKYNANNTSPSFSVSDTSHAKWVKMALFDNKKDSLENDTWMMTQIVDKEKMEYIKKDTTEKKFMLSNTIKQMYFIYEGKLGVRLRYFDINNVFAINQFEALRLGLGVQSHEHLSDWLTFGGYFGYGFKDQAFKYGANIGFYIGSSRQNLLSFEVKKDLLEPGLTKYLEKKQDLVRDFFTNRMDEYQSEKASFTSRINAYILTSLELNNYKLIPYYDYIYNPAGLEEPDQNQIFRFTESSLLINIGTPFSDNTNMRKVLYRNKVYRGNLFLRGTKGWKSQLGGKYDYWRFNAMLNSDIKLGKISGLNIVFDAGVMQVDQPYAVHFVTPGTNFKLTGIIINNAFQTMKLYDFFTDRYAHTFINYDLGSIFFKKSKFQPELAFAVNVGWGRIKGRKEIHELIETRDYPKGYYEAGILINNLLRLKIYNYFYGGLGIGAYVGHGPGAENGAFAIRISYELGAL